MSRRRRGTLHRRRRQHLWRQGRHQSVRRTAIQGPPARRHRPCAMLRADAPVARHADARRSRRPPCIAAQSRSRRRLRRHPLRTRLRNRHGRSIRRRSQLHAGHRTRRTGAASLLPRYAGRERSAVPRCRRPLGSRLRRTAGAADLSVLPRNDGRRTALRIPGRARHRSRPACCTASSDSTTARPSWSATG